MPMSTRRGRFWIAMGSPRAVRVIFALMLVYALVIGGLMLGYARVQQCLARYSDANARSTQIRIQTGADDRRLLLRTQVVDEADRARIIANQRAVLSFIRDINNGRSQTEAFKDLERSTEDSLAVFANNEKERQSIAKERARIEAVRATANPPLPPSEMC